MEASAQNRANLTESAVRNADFKLACSRACSEAIAITLSSFCLRIYGSLNAVFASNKPKNRV